MGNLSVEFLLPKFKRELPALRTSYKAIKNPDDSQIFLRSTENQISVWNWFWFFFLRSFL